MRPFHSYPLAEAYRLLEPGPVTLLTTSWKGRPNVMTMSWHTMMEFTPPLIGCVVSGANFSFQALKKTKECVINIPTRELAREVVGCGNTSGAEMDKFARFDLTTLPAASVQAPVIRECWACLECRVVDSSMVGKYNFFVLEVMQAWKKRSPLRPATLHHRGRGEFIIAGKALRLPSRKK
jgi:flavin reductase (DIM6/NTAB) family NADH-FMN oxidoreductase RutF